MGVVLLAVVAQNGRVERRPKTPRSAVQTRLMPWSKTLAAPVFCLGIMMGLGAVGCGTKESIVATGSGKHLSAEEIDKNPLSLLPGGAIVYAKADVASFWNTAYSGQMLKIANNFVPIPADANFQPSRDVKSLIAGTYSTQGADYAAVVQGTFDPDAIRASAAKGSITPLGKPLQATPYANNTIYSSGEVGFVLLTQNTVLTGNPTGLRRALDRIRDGRVKREVPDWILDVLNTPNAEMVVAGDLSSHPVSAEVMQKMPFLTGLKHVRIVGDFKPPGMNVAGSLTYPDSNTALNGQNAIRVLGDSAQTINMVGWLAGLSNPIQSLETNIPAGTGDLQCKMSVDGNSLAKLLEWVAWGTQNAIPPSAGTAPTTMPLTAPR